MPDQFFGYVWVTVAVLMFVFYIYQLLAKEICFTVAASALVCFVLFAGGTRLWVQCSTFLGFVALTTLFFQVAYRTIQPTTGEEEPLSERLAIALTDFDKNVVGIVKIRNRIYMAKVCYDCTVLEGQTVRIVSLSHSVVGVVAA